MQMVEQPWGVAAYGADRKFLGHQCQASFSVDSRDLDGLEQLIIDITH